MNYKFGYKFASKDVEKFITAEIDRGDEFEYWEPKKIYWRAAFVETGKREVCLGWHGNSREHMYEKVGHYKVVEPDYKTAYAEIIHHIESDGIDVQSLLWLARLYVMGDGVSQDIASACALLCRAADLGCKDAISDLETGFNGRIVRQRGIWNDESFSVLFSEFSRRGYKWAQYAMAMAYADGKIVSKDIDQSTILCIAAALPTGKTEGYWAAQMRIGDLLLKGGLGYEGKFQSRPCICDAFFWYAKISDPDFWTYATDRALIRAKLLDESIEELDEWMQKNTRLFYTRRSVGCYSLESCETMHMPNCKKFYEPSGKLKFDRICRIVSSVVKDVTKKELKNPNEWNSFSWHSYELWRINDKEANMSITSSGIEPLNNRTCINWWRILTHSLRVNAGVECKAPERIKSEKWRLEDGFDRDFVLDFVKKIQSVAYSVCATEDRDQEAASSLGHYLYCYYNKKEDRFAWKKLIVDYPEAIICCSKNKLNGSDWEEILDANPSLIDECGESDAKKIGGKGWARLAAKKKVFLEKGAKWMDWGMLVALNPDRLDVAMEHLTASEWATVLRAHPELKSHCPEALRKEVSEKIKEVAALEKAQNKERESGRKTTNKSASNTKSKEIFKKYWMLALSVLLVLGSFDGGGFLSFVLGVGLGVFWWKKRKDK